MNVTCGIIGLPNVGKSTLFNALVKRQQALVANYPFATIEPNVGIVDVPDPRLDRLAQMVNPKKVIPAVVKFVDIAGLVQGASKGEGLGNQFLSHVRETDALVHVIRVFEDQNIARAGSTNPQSDREVIETELFLADLQTLTNRMEKEQKNTRCADKESASKIKLYDKLQRNLDQGVWVKDISFEKAEIPFVKELNLLTAKPLIQVYNVSENDFIKGNSGTLGNDGIQLCAKLELELCSLNEQEREEYKKELGIHATGLDRVIRRGYEILALQTFFTAGPKEVRAWTIKAQTLAPQAAGVIHTDFERGFISAEVIAFKDYVENGGKVGAREKGLLRLEGRNYVMQDGDVVEFRFSV